MPIFLFCLLISSRKLVWLGLGPIVLTAGQNLNQIQSFVPVVEGPLLLAIAQLAAAAEAGSPMSAAA